MSSSEFNIHPPPALAPSEIVEALRQIVTPHISDSLQRVSGVVGLTRYHRSRKLVGTAFTVKTRPGDNLLIYKALMDMSPGHVLVVDGGADTTNALVGELIMLYAQQRGCAGFVLDAAIRDSAAFSRLISLAMRAVRVIVGLIKSDRARSMCPCLSADKSLRRAIWLSETKTASCPFRRATHEESSMQSRRLLRTSLASRMRSRRALAIRHGFIRCWQRMG